MIRPADISDIPALAKIHVAAWQSAYSHILPDEILNNLSIPQFEANWQISFSDSRRENFVLEVDKKVKGFISFGKGRDNDSTHETGEIYGLYLVPDLWGTGYGRKLWEGILKQLQSRFSIATLWVLQKNRRARGFYERIGFECDNRVKEISLYDIKLSETRYRKHL